MNGKDSESYYLGFRFRDVTPIMENRLENELDTLWIYGFRV